MEQPSLAKRTGMDIGGWLHDLGLERYTAAFRDNEIDAAALMRLTAEDLKGIGVNVVGHRHRLLDAISALSSGSSLHGQGEAEGHSLGTGQGKPTNPTRAERRQITVLFCDLVGSTALSSRLDPEDLQEVLAAYRLHCADVIGRWDGYIANYMGDGLLAYFGYPSAHEDDAERAAQAGLELVNAIGAIGTRDGIALRVRVGIATGLVVVGGEHGVAGETPNRAARFQAIAEPDMVVVDAGTRRRLGELFQCGDLGLVEAKGLPRPLQAWRVSGRAAVSSRSGALHATASLEPMIGREEELELLLRHWAQAKGGDGRVVLISGEPGIGKSRLTAGLAQRLSDEPHILLRFFCSPHHQNTPLFPAIGQLERAAGFNRDDAPDIKFGKLQALLATKSCDEVALVADLLGLPLDGRPLPDLNPQKRRERLLNVLTGHLAGLAARQPILMLFEDAHWIDPTSLELLSLTVDRIRRLSVLLVITFRPEFSPPWTGLPNLAALALGGLGRREAALLVGRTAGNTALPATAIDQIIEHTGGIPLFLEELTRAVVETDWHDAAANASTLATKMLPACPVPAVLYGPLAARLDRLGEPVREVAQIGAAIGREFTYELLASVAGRSDAELRNALERLTEAGLVFRTGGNPLGAAYLFKHALVQDTAYGTLVRTRRRDLHGAIARAIAEIFPEAAEERPELLAHHYAQAGLIKESVVYHLRAGRQAISRSAAAEAVSHLSAGLDALAGLPGETERWRRELELQLQLALATALVTARGYAAPETGQALALARALCREEDDPHKIFPLLNGQVLFHSQRGEPLTAHEIATEMLERARRSGDATLLIPAHRAMSVTSGHRGCFAAMREHAERVLALYDPIEHRCLASLYGFDQGSVALGNLSLALLMLGYADQARSRGEELLAWARDLKHPNSLAQALQTLCVLLFEARDMLATERTAEEAIAVATEHCLPFFLGMGTLFRASARIAQGIEGDLLTEVEQAKTIVLSSGSLRFIGASGTIIETYVRAGRVRTALRLTAEACAWPEKRSFWRQAEAHRLHGELLLLLPEPDRIEAEACFRRAIEIARTQGAKIWGLRAATSLARLWRDQGRPGESRDLLAPVYGWFTEGCDLPDLQDAQTLLDGLG